MSGWEPKQVTRYKYDEDGKVTHSITEREPEWCRADVEAMIAYTEMTRVGPHGQPMSEATSPLANPFNPDREWDYEIDVITDFAEARRSAAVKAYKASYGDAVNMDELRFLVRKVEIQM